MASKKTVKKVTDKFGAKADFIRSQPASLSAKEIVDAAAKQGIKISVNHVYNLRTAAAKKGDAPKGAGVLAPKRGVGRPRASGGGDVERQLRAAIAEVGLQRAREIFDAVAEAFRGR
jgi:cysteine sulfinate desulfinase/cysteine desulfurase-like protein